MAEEFTAKFRVDISDLKKNITDARKEIKLADAAFKAGTAGMDDWKNDAEGLAQKLTQLKTVLSSQKSILDAYRQQLERQEQAYQENGSRADQLRAKLKELAESGVSKTSDEYKKYQTSLKNVLKEQENNGKAADDLRIKILNQEAAIGKTDKELRNYSSALDHAGDETRQLSDASAEAHRMTGNLTDGFTVMRGAIANLIADGIRKLGSELKSLVTDGAAYADEILTLSKTTSLSTDTLQKFSYMSDLVDVDLNVVAGSLRKLTKNMASAQGGTGTAAEAFSSLGVSITDANGELRSNEDVFYDVIEALGQMENETQRDATSMAIFGKSATDLNPMIEAGADALEGWSKEAEQMGYVMDDEMLNSLGEVQDSFDRFDRQMVTVKNTIATGLAPAIKRGADRIRELIAGADWEKFGKSAGKVLDALINGFEWIIKNGPIVKGALEGVLAVMAVSKITKVVDAVKKLGSALKSAASAAAANPYVALAAAAVGCFVAIAKWNQALAENAKANDAGWQATERMKSKLQESTEAMRESIDAGNQMNQTLQESVSAGTAQITHVQTLAGELRNLADENGVVAEKDQARAQFILNELNGALGTEYTMTGNVIDQYSNLTGSLDQVISKKKAMLILKAEEAAYQEALLNQQQAEIDLANAELARMDTQARLADVQSRMNEILSMTGPELAAHAGELGGLKQQEMELTGELENQQATYEALQDTVDTYAWNIQQYTNNATAAIAEDYDAISHKSFEAAQATGEAGNEASQAIITGTQDSQNVWLKSISAMVSEATGKKVEFKSAGDGMVKAMVDGIEQKKQLPANEVRKMEQLILEAEEDSHLPQKMAQSGQNAAQGLANGTNAFGYLAYNAGANLADQFLAGFKDKAGEGSPWKTTKESAHWAVLGFTEEVKKEEKLAADAGEGLADAFLGAFKTPMSGQQAGISGVFGSLQTMKQAAASGGGFGVLGGSAGDSISTTNFTQIINSPKAPSRIELYRQTKNLLNYARS